MGSRIGWIVAALAAGLLLLVVGARQVIRRSDTPLVTAQINPPLAPVPPDGGADAGLGPVGGPDAGVYDGGIPGLPTDGGDGGLVPTLPGAPDGGLGAAADTDADGGVVGEETPVEALARQVEQQLSLESRLSELEDAVDSLEADRELLLDALSAAEERIAALEETQEAEADRLAEQAPRFDRVAVLEGALADLRRAVNALANGSTDLGGALARAAGRIDRVADESSRLGQDLEAERLESALSLISSAEGAVSRSDLYDARISAAQALAFTASARDLARTNTAPL